VHPHVLIAEVDPTSIPSRSEELYFIHHDPMLQEAALMEVYAADAVQAPTQTADKHFINNQVAPRPATVSNGCAFVHPVQQDGGEAAQTGDEQAPEWGQLAPGIIYPAPAQPVQEGSQVAGPTSGDQAPPLTAAPPPAADSSDQALQSFIQEVMQPVVVPVLKTLVKKSAAAKASEAPTIRCSGRLAEKAHSKRSAEELAQDILCKKLEGSQMDFTTQAL
jgi:hypothetical protein